MKISSLVRFVLIFFVTILAAAQSVFASEIKGVTETGEGKPLVLIHAFPSDERLWEPQRQELKNHFRVITINLRGFGSSAPVDGNAVTMSDYADDVKHLLDQLKIHKAIIGGESMGGYIALAFLKKYPDRVSGLILSDTQSIADSEEAKAKRETNAVDVLSHGTSQFIGNFLPKALSSQADAQTRENLKTIVESQSAVAIASALRGMALRSDTSSTLAATSLPVLIITGDQDTLISPQQSENMHKLASNSKLIVITNAGHLSNLEQPTQWNQAVIEMFEKR